MNLKMIVFVIARMLGVEGLLLLTPAVIAVLYGEEEVVFFSLLWRPCWASSFSCLGENVRRIPRFTQRKDLSSWRRPGFSGLFLAHFLSTYPEASPVMWTLF